MNAKLVYLLTLVFSSSVFAADPIELRAGRLSMVFEPDHAFVRYVRVGDQKILQGISAPVRDQYWGTVPPDVKNLRVQQNADSFSAQFEVTCRQGDIDFVWRGSISGNASGKATLTFDGEARSDFLRNRIGFCVLHGPEAAGRPCVVETVDGKSIRGKFPEFISPHQPFKNIRAITHEVVDGVWARVLMEGDTFEMEDQRNWTDASFKTYCTPLEKPYPVRITQGTKVSQRIDISVDGIEKLPAGSGERTGQVRIELVDASKKHPLPQLGLRVSSQVDVLSDSEVERLRALHLDHLRVDVAPADPSAAAELARAAEQAKRLGVRLYVGLHLGKGGASELDRLQTVLKEIAPPSTWLLIAADDEQTAAVRTFLKATRLSGRLGRGEDTNFTELNRKRPDPSGIDLVSYGINPQVHAFDDTSIVETLEIQGDTVRSARQFTGQLPLVISPVTLKIQRVNEPPPAGELPSNVDPRQLSPFAAAWTLGSIKYLAESGVEAATYYETIGWLGIMESEKGSPLPARFPSRPSQLYPVYRVLQGVGEFAGGEVTQTASSDPMSLVGLALNKDGKRRVMLANLSSEPRRAQVRGFKSNIVVRRLAESGWQEDQAAVRQGDEISVQLPAYGIAALDAR